MGDEVKDTIMAHIRRNVMEKTLVKGTRYDGRAFDEYRTVEIQTNVIKTAEGSAIAKIGETTVLAAIKFDVVTPFQDRPTQGVMITNAELLPMASPTFEPGPPGEKSIEAARVVDRAIRSAECIDLNSFFIEEGKVLGIYLDLYVLNHSGNYTDAATLAGTAALINTKMPRVENVKIIRGEYEGPLEMTSRPVTTSMIKVDKNYWLVDPMRDEENVAETVLTIGTTEKHVCAMQKGRGSLSKTELLDAIDIAFKRGNDLRKILKEVE
ncbi:exosome complex protein Rrp42 [Candidatus Micrarchaeota archaeon]|nr:exosome complex protein Rrp42 [Candidatus Micrarchaeota archaeon]MBU1165536.1 exosome complex protein Rrp42 [Candidatus Micrarchaeota archaeon]MBU1886521.1 exosome complex protein Rrp42 [Candidatus Micrarchaeota archaeon]